MAPGQKTFEAFCGAHTPPLIVGWFGLTSAQQDAWAAAELAAQESEFTRGYAVGNAECDDCPDYIVCQECGEETSVR